MTETRSDRPSSGASPAPSRGNLLTRVRRYVREVVAELRKVIWPSRNDLVTYTTVVLVFVIVMTAVIGVLDFLFTKGVLAVYG